MPPDSRFGFPITPTIANFKKKFTQPRTPENISIEVLNFLRIQITPIEKFTLEPEHLTLYTSLENDNIDVELLYHDYFKLGKSISESELGERFDQLQIESEVLIDIYFSAYLKYLDKRPSDRYKGFFKVIMVYLLSNPDSEISKKFFELHKKRIERKKVIKQEKKSREIGGFISISLVVCIAMMLIIDAINRNREEFKFITPAEEHQKTPKTDAKDKSHESKEEAETHESGESAEPEEKGKTGGRPIEPENEKETGHEKPTGHSEEKESK